jgi:hypothetical protein
MPCLAREVTAAIVPIVLTLAVVLIMFNIKHSMMCSGGGEGADEAALKRQALEKRLLSLEQEALENSILLEKFIRRLDDKFGLSKAAPLSDLKQASHAEAMFISARLAEEPAPPMPSFADMYSDPETLSNEIDNAMDRFDDDLYGDPSGSAYSAGGAGAFGGAYAEAEFVDENGATRPPVFGADLNALPPAVSPEEATRQCTIWKEDYDVTVGISWGTLPLDLQDKWRQYNCDTNAAAGIGL